VKQKKEKIAPAEEAHQIGRSIMGIKKERKRISRAWARRVSAPWRPPAPSKVLVPRENTRPALCRHSRSPACLPRAWAWIAASCARQLAGHRGPAQLPVLWMIRLRIAPDRSLALARQISGRSRARSTTDGLCGQAPLPSFGFFCQSSFAGFHSNFDRY
jgi:hypothetical protein